MSAYCSKQECTASGAAFVIVVVVVVVLSVTVLFCRAITL